MEYMELVETETDGDERKRLMANYNMLSTAKTTITSVSSTLYSTSGIGVTLLLLGFCFAYVPAGGQEVADSHSLSLHFGAARLRAISTILAF